MLPLFRCLGLKIAATADPAEDSGAQEFRFKVEGLGLKACAEAKLSQRVHGCPQMPESGVASLLLSAKSENDVA